MFSSDIKLDKLLSKFSLTKSNIEPLRKSNWLIGLSGGADSILTLFFLYQLDQYFHFSRVFIFFFLEHELSSNKNYTNIYDDRKHIIQKYWNYIQKNSKSQLIYHYEKANVAYIAKKIGTSFERAGSLIRHKRILKLSSKYNIESIFFGHTLSDWYETLIMRINRGGGIHSIYPHNFSQNSIFYNSYRPLFFLFRDEVRSLCQEYNLQYWKDPTNSNMNFLRNRVRDSFPIFNKQGMRRTAINFLKEKDRMKHKREYLYQKIHSLYQEIVKNREYRILYKDFLVFSQKEQKFIMQYMLRRLGLYPLKRTLQENFFYIPFSYKNFHIEIENWGQEYFLIFRRGRNNLLVSCAHSLTEFTGNNITKQFTIKTKIGKKSVKKIFSELKLSNRQRKIVRIQIENLKEKTVKKIIFTNFNIPDKIAYLN